MGDRGPKFVSFLRRQLLRAGLTEEFVDECLRPRCLDMFSSAFTSASADPDNNYEYFEQLGDATVNKFVVSYMYQRFPQLRCREGVKVVARLKIKYVSKDELFQIAKDLDFWNFVAADEEERSKKKKSLLEDVFEAFIGCTETVVNEVVHSATRSWSVGTGYEVCHHFLSSVYDKIHIKIDYENLVDAKTRIKELFDEKPDGLHRLRYEDVRDPENGLYVSTVYADSRFLARASSPLKKEAQENASAQALIVLRRMGYHKEVPSQYRRFVCK